jgi:hypothetical protein
MESQREEIEKAVGMAAVWRATMDSLQKTLCAVQTAREIYAGQIGFGEKELSANARNTIDGLTGLFQRGLGNRGETVADVLNGFTQYATRGFEGSKKDIFKRIQSAEFGGMADTKAEFASRLSNPDAREAMRKNGEALLAAVN